jgi:beta-exotoxin I transport system ATP-binding protein
MTVAIHTAGLTKFYGKVRGIADVDLDVEEGEVFGFLGPNGAGKSTTIRLLLDFIRPTSGSATVLGLDSRGGSVDIHRRVGYLPGDLAMYDDMTARELLLHFGALRGLSGGGRAMLLAERFQLDVSRQVRSYSTGNRQKLGIVQAFMHEPELLILDEPTTGLDPMMQIEFYRLIEEARSEGRTVFLSSHVLPEVERVARRVGIIRSGTVVVVESVSELKHKALRRIELRFGAPVDAAEFTSLPGVRSAASSASGTIIQITATGSVDPVIKAAARHEVTSIVSHDGDLEEAFLAYYSDPSGAIGAE